MPSPLPVYVAVLRAARRHLLTTPGATLADALGARRPARFLLQASINVVEACVPGSLDFTGDRALAALDLALASREAA